jgi:hypothetical protein
MALDMAAFILSKGSLFILPDEGDVFLNELDDGL